MISYVFSISTVFEVAEDFISFTDLLVCVAVPDYGRARVSSPSIQDPDWLMSTDMAELFSKLGLGKYTYLFQEQEVSSVRFIWSKNGKFTLVKKKKSLKNWLLVYGLK